MSGNFTQNYATLMVILLNFKMNPLQKTTFVTLQLYSKMWGILR